jgi:glycine cleavage system H protein
MNAILEFLQSAGVFLAGLLIRLLGLVVVIAAYAVPILIIYGLYLAFRWLRARQLGLEEVKGLVLAEARYYSPGHTWLAMRWSGRLRVGLDDLAQRLLPGATEIHLPRVGTEIAAGSPAVTISCGERMATVPAPVAGRVVAVNEAVACDPNLVHAAPYGRGWLFAIQPATASFKRNLRTGRVARVWFEEEEERLAQFLEGELGLAAADGGELVFPAPALLSNEKWHALVDAFLKA